jgi:DNA-binding NarL/FixJ family response regulator
MSARLPKTAISIPTKKRVLIVEDHPMMRDAVTQLVNQEPDLELVLATGDPAAALDAIASFQPHLVILDMTLPGKNGLELLKDMRALAPDIQVLVLSMHDETLYAERVLKAGGRGYIMKDSPADEISKALRTVLDGQIYISPRISGRIIEAFSGSRSAKTASPVDRLSDREFQVFQLIGQGRSTKEIGGQLNISAKTVEVHRIAIKKKLNIGTAAELAHHAVLWINSQSGGGLVSSHSK